jgi:hypothetical protein
MDASSPPIVIPIICYYHCQPSPMPEGHLACFVDEIAGQLDLSEITQQCCGRDSKAHHP